MGSPLCVVELYYWLYFTERLTQWNVSTQFGIKIKNGKLHTVVGFIVPKSVFMK